MDALRCDIRNKMNKVNQAIEYGTILVPTQPGSDEESQDEDQHVEDDGSGDEIADAEDEVSPTISKSKVHEKEADT